MDERLAQQPQPPDEARHVEPDETVKPAVSASKTTKCPACNIGVLYVIAHDPDATHEVGNAEASDHANFEASGGSQIVHCFHCGYQASQALGEREAS